MASVRTIANLKSIFEDIANRSYILKGSFGYGKVFEYGKTQNLSYPVLWVTPDSAVMIKNASNSRYPIMDYTYILRCLDRVRKNETNEVQVESDTLQTLTQIVTELSTHPYYQRSDLSLVDNISFTPLKEFSDDDVSGHECFVTFRMLNQNTFCGIPFAPISGASFPGGELTGLTYNPGYLTCATVTGCTTLQNFVHNSISPAFSGASYIQSSSTISFNTIGGDTINVTGITAGGGETYWTSGSTGTESIKAINGTGLDATNDYAVAINQNTFASGVGSFASGNESIASGSYSHAEGESTRATGYTSHAEGNSSAANGDTSHAEGNATIASGTNSHSEGDNTEASGYASHSEGTSTTASGDSSHAEGSNSQANGDYSHAEGDFGVASGYASHAEGSSTQASGHSSHAEGRQTLASGDYSHTEGIFTQATAFASHAGGFNSLASGTTSFVHGDASTAGGSNTIVLGANIVGLDSNKTYVDNFNIKTVPAGTSINNLGIDSDGNVIIGSSSFLNLSGGTVTGNTIFTQSVSANTLSANTFFTGDLNLNKLLYNESSTGLISFSGLSFAASATTFSVAPIVAYFASNGAVSDSSPNVQYKSFPASTGNILSNLSGQNVTYVAINSGGTIQQQSIPYNETQKRTMIPLGIVVHSNRTFINAVNNSPVVAINPLNQLSDFFGAVGFINISGNLYSANGANLNLNKSSGHIFKEGSNWLNDPLDPHTLALSAITATSFRYRFQNGNESGDTQTISADTYDNGGVATAVPGNRFTVQRITLFQSNLTRIQFGQQLYSNMADAIVGIDSDPFVVEQNIAENGITRMLLIIRGGTTDLTDTSRVKFIELGKFGSTIGVGGQSTTTLQQAYNNSTEPEITTDSTLGAVTITNGSGSNNNNVLEIKNSGATTTAFITGLGGLSATSITAATYYNVPTIFGSGASGNGGTINSGVTGYLVMGHSGIITGWDLIGATSGSVVMDIWKTTGSTLPTVANSITDAAKPRITAGVYSGSTNLSAWSGLTYQTGDKFGFNIDSVSGFTTLSLTIRGTKQG